MGVGIPVGVLLVCGVLGVYFRQRRKKASCNKTPPDTQNRDQPKGVTPLPGASQPDIPLADRMPDGLARRGSTPDTVSESLSHAGLEVDGPDDESVVTLEGEPE